MIHRRHLPVDDSGSVMMLVIGLVPILFLMIAVGTDAAVLFTHKRSLAAEADAAAVEGAQAADLRALYEGRGTGLLPLDCQQARRVVTGRVGSSVSDHRVTHAKLASFGCDGSTVSVSLRSKVTLPFASNLGIDPTVNVSASAQARSPLR